MTQGSSGSSNQPSTTWLETLSVVEAVPVHRPGLRLAALLGPTGEPAIAPDDPSMPNDAGPAPGPVRVRAMVLAQYRDDLVPGCILAGERGDPLEDVDLVEVPPAKLPRDVVRERIILAESVESGRVFRQAALAVLVVAEAVVRRPLGGFVV